MYSLLTEIRCPEPESEGGITVQVSTRSIGGVAHYQCPRGQYMEGNSTRICLKRGRWSSKIPKCQCRFQTFANVKLQLPHCNQLLLYANEYCLLCFQGLIASILVQLKMDVL